MRDNGSCRDVDVLLPEVALSIATGEERALVLDHVARCPACRQRLEELAQTADELMLLVPEREPPPGFESRVRERMGPRPSRRRTWRRLGAMALAAGLGAVGVLGGLWLATGSLRSDAAHYRTALAVADGTYFGARPMLDPAGRQGGFVFSYAGEPSWVVVVARDLVPGARYEVEAVGRGGAAFDLGGVVATDGNAVLGASVPIPPRDLARLRVLDADDTMVLEAVFPPPHE
ncbi:MAG: zf-HC2 domain-containing protein [Actinomycetota bacterium]|nr:zf-HC2 domain-containing protein [Actinomycetota bacterium]